MLVSCSDFGKKIQYVFIVFYVIVIAHYAYYILRNMYPMYQQGYILVTMVRKITRNKFVKIFNFWT